MLKKNTKVVAVAAALVAFYACANSATTRQVQGTNNPGYQPTPNIQPDAGANPYPPPQYPQGQVQPPYQPVPTLPAVVPTTSVPQNPGIVEFRIKAGTGQGPWNDASNPVIVKLPASGSVTLRIINDDSAPHILHTNGAPCPHGNIIAPLRQGDRYDCVIRAPFDSVANAGSMYDHGYGQSATFYMKAQRGP